MLTNTSPLISVIMNCHNGARYLNSAIDSVLTQSYENWELIFWDNCSKDESAQILAIYDDDRIHYHLASELTDLGEARNKAVDKARGEWVAFLDVDDVWLPEKLMKQVEIIRYEDESLGLVYGRMELLIENMESNSKWGERMNKDASLLATNRLPEGDIFEALLHENFIPMVSSMVKRKKYLELGGINPNYNRAEDYDLFIKIAREYKVRAVQDVICRYRIHENNMSHVRVADNYHEAIEIISRYLPDKRVSKCIRKYQTLIAVEEIRAREIIQGVIRIVKKGTILFLIERLLLRLRRASNIS